MRYAIAAALLLASASAYAGEETQVYISIIVKACPISEDNVEPGHAAASGAQGLPTGMIPKPETWRGRGELEAERQNAMTKEERHAHYRKVGCIDVPIPPDVINTEMTMARCAGKTGYFVAMQYLEQNATITQKAVGGWVCVPHAYPVIGVAAQ